MSAVVLYLSYDGLTDPLGQSQILPYAVGLSKKDYKFTIISFEKHSVFLKQRGEIEAICKKYGIEWVPLRYHKRPPVISTVYDVWELWREVKKKYHQKKIQIVHCRSYLTSLIGLHAKHKWGVKFIFDMRGFWADERVEGGLWNLENPVYKLTYKFFKRKERQFLREADHIISLTHNAKKELQSWNIGAAPIAVIPTCVDLDLFDPSKIKKEDQIQLRTKLGIGENEFVLLYLGSWGTWYLTERMLKFFSVLKKQTPEAKFLIVSSNNIDLNDHPFRSSIVIANAQRHLVPLYISLASASVFFINPSFSKKASSATKMAEIMAMNVPVITNPGWGDAVEIVSEAGGTLYNDEKEINPMKYEQLVKTRAYCREKLSLETGIDKYQTVYDDLVNSLKHAE